MDERVKIMGFRKLWPVVMACVVSIAMPAQASDIIIDNASGTREGTPGGFSYIGQGNSKDHMGGRNFDIYNMVVSRSDQGLMRVRINTGFVDINATHQGGRKFYYGDLFMSTTGWNPTGNPADGYQGDNAFNTGTKWNYVYDLNGARYKKGSFTDTRSARLGKLADYDMNEESSRKRFVYGSDRYDEDRDVSHLYRAGRNAVSNKFGQGSVEANTSDNYLEFIFDVTGTELASAQQIAFHWTMSCANDVIEGVVNFGNKVSAPALVSLFLLGLGGIAFTRRQRQSPV